MSDAARLDDDQLDLFRPPSCSAAARRETPPPVAVTPRTTSTPFRFFLGTHHAAWLEATDMPLFLSRRTLEKRRTLPRARGPWALDSGGFTELSMHGRWTVAPRAYAALVARCSAEVGGLQWAAAQDWMCEEAILKRTGRSVADHQRLTIENYLELRHVAPELPWMPVLQGWTTGDYRDHLDQYAAAGVDLTTLPQVGVGTVCRRQHTLRASFLLSELSELGLKVHAFGFKVTGLLFSRRSLVSSDSLAWSLNARRNPPLPDCDHAKCSNCIRFALDWRERVLARLDAADPEGVAGDGDPEAGAGNAADDDS